MAAEKKTTADADPAPSDSGDRPETVSGPSGWERTRIRRWLDRLKQAEEAGTDPNDGLPEPSDREELLDDVLTAAFGPPWPAAVPERFRNDPEALHGWARWRKRRAEREREAALIRLVQSYPRPIHKERWKHLRDEVRDELRRRGRASDSSLSDDWEEKAVGLISARLEDCALDDWQIEALVRAGAVKNLDPEQVSAALEAIYYAAVAALADEDLRSATAEKIESRLQGALQQAFAGDLVGPRWRERSNSRRRVDEDAKPLEALDDPDLDVRMGRHLAPDDLDLAARTRLRAEKRVRQAEKLTEEQKVVWLLRYRDGLTPTETAEELDISREAVQMRLKRAEERLAETA